MNNRDNHSGNSLAPALMLDSAARDRSRDVCRAARAVGPLTLNVTLRPGQDHRHAAPAGGSSSAARTTGDWARHLAASARSLRN